MKKFGVSLILFIFFITSCYDYNFEVIYSSFMGHQIIKKVVSEKFPESDGYFYYKDNKDSVAQDLKLFIRVMDGNESLDPILWSDNGKSFVFLFRGTISKLDKTTFKTRLLLFSVEDGIANRRLELINEDIKSYFFSDSTFSYVLEDKSDTISVRI
jgi:hypothetical protein